mgnify:CR=1 FL=1
MQVQINTQQELLDFIKSDEVTKPQAEKIVTHALNVFLVSDLNKEQLIKETEIYIDNFCQDSTAEKPIFLGLDLSVM